MTRRDDPGHALGNLRRSLDHLRAELAPPSQPACDDDDLTDTIAGRHRLERRLARGGMGDVYLASARGDATLVAVKVLRRGMDSAALIRACQREQKALAALHHPGIVELIDAGQLDDGRPFLVTSYVAGQHLDDACCDRRLGARAIAALALEICRAVHHAHARGVVHCDLKPTNIVVDVAGDPVVLDFGVARLCAAANGDASVTRSSLPLTPYFASPELLAGAGATPRSDVYALGVMLRDLLASAPPEPPSRLHKSLAAVVERATATDPAERPRDAGELAGDLQRSLLGMRVSARRWRRALRRRRRAIAAAALMLLLVGAASLVAISSNDRANAAKVEALSVSEFLVHLLDHAGPRAQGAGITLPTALRLAEAQIPTTFDGKPEGEYRVRMAYGRAYAQYGDWQRAAVHLRRAIEILESIPDPYPGSLTWCRNLLAKCERSG